MASRGKKTEGKKPLTTVMEDYMEAIFDISQEKKIVRVKDIAKKMNVKMPTVSSMLKTLKSKGMIHYEKYEYVELSQSGKAVGKEMRRKHQALLKFLTAILKIDPDVADGEACKMEHALSTGTLDTLIDFMEFIQNCPRAGESWLKAFEDYRQKGSIPENCQMRCENYATELTRIKEGDIESL